MKVDRNLEELVKALDIAGAGDILMQPEVDKVIQSLILVNNPLRNNIPRKTGGGKEALINKRTVAPDSSWVNDTEEPGDSNSTYTQTPFIYRTVVSRGKVTRKLQATGRTYADIKAEETNACLDVIRDGEEWALFNGDNSGDPKQPDGLRNLIPVGQVLTLGTGNGAALTLEAMDEAIDACYGQPNMIIASKRSRRQLNALLQSSQRFVDRTEVNGGFKLISYNDIPIFWSQHISDIQVEGTSSNASDLFVVDTTKFWTGVLSELTLLDLAKTSSQFDSFDVYEDIVPVLANEKYCSRIEGIIPPA